MGLYRHPEVYATLLSPEPDVFEHVLDWIDVYLDGPFGSVMDPCCGPGTWLLPFSVRELHVAGNDLLPQMVAECRRRLGAAAELTQRDMRALAFETGPFDVVFNLHSSIGHLADLAAAAEHLASVRDHLRPGGLYFLGACVYDGDRVDEDVHVLYESEPMYVPSGGMAAVRYESVRRDPVRCEETIRLHLLSRGVAACPESLEEEYVLKTFQRDALRDLLDDVGGFDLLAVHAMEEDGHPDRGLQPDCGDVTLVLRKRP